MTRIKKAIEAESLPTTDEPLQNSGVVAIAQPHGGALTPWPKGVSGNPRGRRSVGLSFQEWANALQDAGERELMTVLADKQAPSPKLAAASQLLRMRQGEGEAIDRLCDRTAGKPTQAVAIASETVHTQRIVFEDAPHAPSLVTTTRVVATTTR